MTPVRAALFAASLLVAVPCGAQTLAQTVVQRGFVDGSLVLFPQKAPNDPTHAVADVRLRDEVFVKPAPWLQIAAGVDLRANSHDQIADDWRIDLADRGTRRPRIALRRLTGASESSKV